MSASMSRRCTDDRIATMAIGMQESPHTCFQFHLARLPRRKKCFCDEYIACDDDTALALVRRESRLTSPTPEELLRPRKFQIFQL